jgi:MFS family permease
MVGALLVGPLLEHFGRKRSLILVTVPYMASFLLMGFTFFGRNKSQLYIGRILNGLAAGAATPASQIYVRFINTCFLSSFF